MGTHTITLHITNNGGNAKKARFCVIEGDQLIYGYPAPTAVFRPGESRLIATSARASGEKTARGFVSASIWPDDTSTYQRSRGVGTSIA